MDTYTQCPAEFLDAWDAYIRDQSDVPYGMDCRYGATAEMDNVSGMEPSDAAW